MRGARVLLRPGRRVSPPVEAERLIVDQRNGERDVCWWVRAGSFDTAFEIGGELLGAVGLAGVGVTGDDDQLYLLIQ